MKKILNLTQHESTKEQKDQGVFEPSKKDKEYIKQLLTFEDIPSKDLLEQRAKSLTAIALTYGVEKIMIGGAPYFMSFLERELKFIGMKLVYSFSKRVVEEVQNDKEVVKISSFKHIGFIEL